MIGSLLNGSRMKQSTIQSMHSAMPLSEKMTLIQRAVEHDYFGKRLIPCCMPFDGGAIDPPRPWRVNDFAGQSVPRFRCNKPGKPVQMTPADWLNFENSTSFSGEYLLSQVLRYQATQDESALAEAGRALTALQAIAALPGEERFGWLCKPFGGRSSQESSPDQNICAMAGLQQFLPYADKTQAAWIRNLMAAVPQYWERINYTIDFGDAEWDLRGDVAHMRIFNALALLSKHNARVRSADGIARRLHRRYGEFCATSASLFDTFTQHQPGYFDHWRVAGEFAGATLLFVPLTLNMLATLQQGDRHHHLAALRRCLAHGLIGFDPALFGHYYLHEARLDPTGNGAYLWRPLVPERADGLSRYRAGWQRWMLFEYPHRLLWFDATARLPLAYMIYLSLGGSAIPNIDRIVREIMHRLDFPRLHWMVDHHNDSTPEELQFVLHAMTSEAPMYLAAYWLGRRLNVW